MNFSFVSDGHQQYLSIISLLYQYDHSCSTPSLMGYLPLLLLLLACARGAPSLAKPNTTKPSLAWGQQVNQTSPDQRLDQSPLTRARQRLVGLTANVSDSEPVELNTVKPTDKLVKPLPGQQKLEMEQAVKLLHSYAKALEEAPYFAGERGNLVELINLYSDTLLAEDGLEGHKDRQQLMKKLQDSTLESLDEALVTVDAVKRELYVALSITAGGSVGIGNSLLVKKKLYSSQNKKNI